MKLFRFHQRYPTWSTWLSTAADGPLPTSRNLDDSPHSARLDADHLSAALHRRNRRLFLEKLNIAPSAVVSARLIHGTTIISVTSSEGGRVIDRTDGLSTKDQNLYLSVTVADCLPLFFFDPKRNAVGLAHAGWRGLAANMPGKMVEHLAAVYASAASDLFVGLGPAIGPCHYAVGREVAAQFPDNGSVTHHDGQIWLDLQAVARRQLITAGINLTNIEVDNRCTYEHPDLFSFRRDRDLAAGVMMTLTGIQKDPSE